MRILIEQDITGTGTFIWILETGPERIDRYSGFSETIVECFDEIIKYITINALDYAN